MTGTFILYGITGYLTDGRLGEHKYSPKLIIYLAETVCNYWKEKYCSILFFLPNLCYTLINRRMEYGAGEYG